MRKKLILIDEIDFLYIKSNKIYINIDKKIKKTSLNQNEFCLLARVIL